MILTSRLVVRALNFALTMQPVIAFTRYLSDASFKTDSEGEECRSVDYKEQ